MINVENGTAQQSEQDSVVTQLAMESMADEQTAIPLTELYPGVSLLVDE